MTTLFIQTCDECDLPPELNPLPLPICNKCMNATPFTRCKKCIGKNTCTDCGEYCCNNCVDLVRTKCFSRICPNCIEDHDNKCGTCSECKGRTCIKCEGYECKRRLCSCIASECYKCRMHYKDRYFCDKCLTKCEVKECNNSMCNSHGKDSLCVSCGRNVCCKCQFQIDQCNECYNKIMDGLSTGKRMERCIVCSFYTFSQIDICENKHRICYRKSCEEAISELCFCERCITGKCSEYDRCKRDKCFICEKVCFCSCIDSLPDMTCNECSIWNKRCAVCITCKDKVDNRSIDVLPFFLNTLYLCSLSKEYLCKIDIKECSECNERVSGKLFKGDKCFKCYLAYIKIFNLLYSPGGFIVRTILKKNFELSFKEDDN